MTGRLERRWVNPDLRSVIDRKLSEGWEVVSRDPLTLARVGCKQRYEVNSTGCLVQVRGL